MGFAILLLAQSALAAKVCSGIRIEEDPFEKKMTLTATWSQFKIQHQENQTLLTVTVGQSGITDETLRAGIPVSFLLDNGTRINLKTDRPSESVSGAYATQYSAGTYTQWKLALPVTNEALHAFASGRAELVRITLGDNVVTDNLSKAEGLTTQRSFACVANQLGNM